MRLESQPNLAVPTVPPPARRTARVPVSQRAPSSHQYGWRTQFVHGLKRLGHAVEVVVAAVGPICPNRHAADSVQIGSRTVRYYRHWPDEPAMLTDWDALSRTTPGATVFQSPHWIRATVRSADALGRLRLVTVHQNDRLVGALPLERRWGGRLYTLGVLTTAYQDPLIVPESAAETWSTALQGIAQLCPDTRSITFERLSPETSMHFVEPLAPAVGFTGGKLVSTHITDTVIDLAPTWDLYLAKLKGHDRKEIRRKLRKAEEAGAELVIADTPADVGEVLPPLLKLMREDGGAKGRKARWLFRRHLADCAPALAGSGRLAVYQLRINRRLAAGVIALTQGNRQMLWNTAMDDEFSQWSPGIVLFSMIFRRAIELQQPSINLGLGLMPYKYALGAVERPLFTMTLTR